MEPAGKRGRFEGACPDRTRTMPRYFIDTSDGQRPLIDNVGQEFPDAQAARRAALDALPDMARDELPNGDHRTFAVSVRDTSGKAIYSAKLMLEGHWHNCR